MANLSIDVIIGISVAISVFLVLGCCVLFLYIVRRKKQIQESGSDQRRMQLPIRMNGLGTSAVLSDVTMEADSPPHRKEKMDFKSWFGGFEKNAILSHSGLPSFPYRDLQRATDNFTTKLGEGAFGPVFKAIMPEGGIFAVKVLSSKSKQGDREFLNEVSLLARLRHRNLVNLVGYCAERGHRILVYEFMGNGNLAELLYGDDRDPLSWDVRVQIAQDVATGILYLHETASPPIIHRDIKSANILLDSTMKARVADFGLSKEAEVGVGRLVSGVRGTFGYVDPEYISTSQFTFKSDVYSFGILLFELITARNPQKGLMDYVGLALLNEEGEEGWAEIVDDRISKEVDATELKILATVAKQCVSPRSQNRPTIREVLQQISVLGCKMRIHTRRSRTVRDTAEEAERT